MLHASTSVIGRYLLRLLGKALPDPGFQRLDLLSETRRVRSAPVWPWRTRWRIDERCRRLLILHSRPIGPGCCGVGLCVALVIKALWVSNLALERPFRTHAMPVRLVPRSDHLKPATWGAIKPLADDTDLFALRTEGGKEADLLYGVCGVKDACGLKGGLARHWQRREDFVFWGRVHFESHASVPARKGDDAVRVATEVVESIGYAHVLWFFGCLLDLADAEDVEIVSLRRGGGLDMARYV
jgi:hypothetical protein